MDSAPTARPCTVVTMRSPSPHHPPPQQHLVLRVTGMTCRHCVRQVTAALRDVAGVDIVEADATTCHIQLRGTFHEADVLTALTRAGHAADVVAEHTTATSPQTLGTGRPRLAPTETPHEPEHE